MMKLTATGKIKAKTDHGTARKERRERERKARDFQIRMLEGKLRAQQRRLQERLTVKREVHLPDANSLKVCEAWQAQHAYVNGAAHDHDR